MQNKKLSGTFNWKLLAGILISALFIFLALRKVDISRMWYVIKSADILPLFLVVILTYFQYVIRAWRWGILLEPVKETGFCKRLSSTIIGFAANFILPARLGEFIRAAHMGYSEDISGSSVFGTIVVERLFDGFTLLLILFVSLFGISFLGEWASLSNRLRGTGVLLLLFYILLIILLSGIKYREKPFLNLLNRILFFLPGHFRSKIIHMIREFSLGLVLMKSPYKWLLTIFYSLFLWFTSLCQIQLVEQSIGLSLPFIATFLVLTLASLGVMIPSAPGFIGTFHLSVQYGFIFYGIGREEALSAAILWHAVMFITTVLLGFIAFLSSNVSHRQILGN